MSITVGYWNFPGFGQPIRLLLSYTDCDFKEE